MHIALVMMLKNEEKRLRATLDSIVNTCDTIIVYDTGSIDTTIDILNDFSRHYNKSLYVKHGEFVDFSTSRNECLDFADTIPGVDFLLLLDCNDELRGGEELRKFCTKQMPTDETAWLVNQEWFSGVYNKYYNIRLIRPNASWRYKGVVHEWIQKQDNPEIYVTNKVPLPVCLFQDRTKDDDKTGKRFHRDRELLENEHKTDPLDCRTVFYLAQTYSCLGMAAEAYNMYLLRSTMGGFQEEVFQCFLRMGDIAKEYTFCNETCPENRIHKEEDSKEVSLLRSFTWDIALKHYLDAFQHSCRAEPMVAIAEYYRSKNSWLLSFHFARMACELEFPHQAILFVDNNIYDYTRYHLLGIVGFYCARFQEGYDACKKAYELRKDDFDAKNMRFYEDILFPQRKLKRANKIAGRRKK
jgi:glycosyltransferase involved in cell wall biosynthesis